jgi:hypothetical protein
MITLQEQIEKQRKTIERSYIPYCWQQPIHILLAAYVSYATLLEQRVSELEANAERPCSDENNICREL